MEKKKFTKSLLQSAYSLLVLGIFAWLGIASLGGSQQARHIGNGVYETAKFYGNGNVEVITGKQDGRGNYHGQIIITFEKDGIVTEKEEVTMVNGVRHGESRMTYQNGYVETKCYDNGYTVDCEKSVRIFSEDTTAYQIFSQMYPWMLFKFNALGIDSSYVESFIDTMETIISSSEIQEEEFDGLYDDVINNMDDTHFDSIVGVYSEIVLFYGLDLIKQSEFRMATIDNHRSGDSSTYNQIVSVYPNYLLNINYSNISNQNFENFCGAYDSLLYSYGPLDTDDPDFVDSLDNRMFRALEYFYSEEEPIAAILISVKEKISSGASFKTGNYPLNLLPSLKHALLDSSNQVVSGVVAGLMLYKYIGADLIRKSLIEAWYLKNGLMQLPVVTTSLSEIVSNTTVAIKGNVIEDDGAEITSRGIVWADYYNPDGNDQVIFSGTGPGEFSETISGLEEDKTYYARAFATNSAGTTYGNCIEFTASTATNIIENELSAEIKIYPNPANDFTTVQFRVEIPENWTFTIVDMKGRMVYSQSQLSSEKNSVRLNLTKFESGVYNCRLTNGRNQISQKFLVAR
jgi:hypothetical protein